MSRPKRPALGRGLGALIPEPPRPTPAPSATHEGRSGEGGAGVPKQVPIELVEPNREQPRKRFDGQVLLLFLASYAALRFGLEFLRADDRGGFASLSTSQWLGLAVLVAVAAAWRPLARLATAPRPAPAPPRSGSDRRSSEPDGSDPPDPR